MVAGGPAFQPVSHIAAEGLAGHPASDGANEAGQFPCHHSGDLAFRLAGRVWVTVRIPGEQPFQGEGMKNQKTIRIAAVLPFIIAGCMSTWCDARASATPCPARMEKTGSLRIGTWNVLNLGHNNGKNYTAVARVIERNFDVVALVEVMQKGRTHPGYDKLKETLGPRWNGLITSQPRPNDNSGNAEFYVIFYRNDRVGICEGWEGLVYHQDNDGTQGEHVKDHFRREPAFACLQSKRDGTMTGFDFMLAVYHARWNGEGTRDEKEAQRINEVSGVVDVFRAMSSIRPGEEDLIIAGDFNLTPVKLKKALNRWPAMSGPGSTLNSSGERTQNIYDYILVHDAIATSEMTGVPMIIDVRGVVADRQTFVRTVSDHLPVVAVFKTDGDDDD